MSTEAGQTAAANETDKRGARGSGRTKLYLPNQILVPELDGPILGLADDEKARIDGLEPWEQVQQLAPYRVRGLLAHFAGDPHACAMRSSRSLTTARRRCSIRASCASCESGVNEPVIVTDIGNLPSGEPALLCVEGRQRTRSLRYWNNQRAAETPPAPPLSLNCIVRVFSSPKKAREVRIVTANHVALSPLQRAERAQELLDSGVAPVDAAPLCGFTSAKALKLGMEILKRPEAVKDAVASGAVTAQALMEMRHLSAGEQTRRADTIASQGLRGRRARQVARTGQTTEETTKAPARSISRRAGQAARRIVRPDPRGVRRAHRVEHDGRGRGTRPRPERSSR